MCARLGVERMQIEREDRDECNADLGEFDPARHHRFVESIGELAAEGGEKEVGCDEDRGGERDQRFCVRAADMEQDEKDQGVLQKIVAERGEELSPEQGREAPSHEQGRGHDLFRWFDRTPAAQLLTAAGADSQAGSLKTIIWAKGQSPRSGTNARNRAVGGVADGGREPSVNKSGRPGSRPVITPRGVVLATGRASAAPPAASGLPRRSDPQPPRTRTQKARST